MNPDKNTRLFIIMLAAGLLLVGTTVFLQGQSIMKMQKSLSKIADHLQGTEYGPPPNIEQNDCVLSGGEYKNGACVCGKDYFLEAGQCMGQDGLTKKEIEEIKAGQERLMMQSEGSNVVIAGLTFDLPAEWSLLSNVGGTAKIQVPDPKYRVVLPFSVQKVAERERPNLGDHSLITRTDSGASLYQEACAPTLLCQYIEITGMIYLATFEMPESNEPVPNDLDGVWFPRTTVTEAQMAQVIKSVR